MVTAITAFDEGCGMDAWRGHAVDLVKLLRPYPWRFRATGRCTIAASRHLLPTSAREYGYFFRDSSPWTKGIPTAKLVRHQDRFRSSWSAPPTS